MKAPGHDDHGSGGAVELSADIAARPDTVWGFLSDAEGFSAWMEGEVTFEPRAGSPFRAVFPNYQIVLGGEIVALDPEARRLGVTWGIESGPQAEEYPAGSSLVEFHVRSDGAGCRVDLRHMGLSSAQAAREQEGGWRFQLSKLDLKANRIDLAAGLERTLPDWVAAWNETDAEAGSRCCDNVVVKTLRFATSGRPSPASSCSACTSATVTCTCRGIRLNTRAMSGSVAARRWWGGTRPGRAVSPSKDSTASAPTRTGRSGG